MGLGKSTLYSILPPGTRWRELWLPELINNHATLPRSVSPGHDLALTGARKGTTVDGVRFNGLLNSNINCGVIHNAAAKLWVSFRFKLDRDFGTGEPLDMMLFGKWIGVNDYIEIWLNDTTPNLYFRNHAGGGDAFLINRNPPAGDTWRAGVWYHVLASIGQAIGGGSASDGARLRWDNGAAATSPDVTAVPNGGSFVIGDERDPGAGWGIEGVIADFWCGTDDLTEAEEDDLYRGIPPADAVNAYPLDEGRGVTAYDRGSGGNNGTIDTSCTWAWGQVEQPVISFDAINDRAVSSAGVDLSGAFTYIWVGKMKSTYDGLSAGENQYFCVINVDANNHIHLRYLGAGDYLLFEIVAAGNTYWLSWLTKPAIDDYWIVIGTLDSGHAQLFLNGNLLVTDTETGAIAGAATAYIGCTAALSNFDISKPLLIGLIDGALSERQARIFSKTLNNLLGLGIAI